MTRTPPPPAMMVRRLIRSQDAVALATRHVEGDWPYVSLVLVASDVDATPLLLLSALAEHSRNIAADARVSLLFDGTASHDSRLTGPRATVLGRAVRTRDPRHRARFLARHPEAALYADFSDFAFYRMTMERAHLVAGFGEIHWIEGPEVLLADADDLPLAAQEGEVTAHMNDHHADAVQLLANLASGTAGNGWTMTGCDPEGADFRRGGAVSRLWFDTPVHDADGARVELVRLVKQARQSERDMFKGQS